MARRIDVEVVPHPTSTDHKIVKIRTRGRVYGCTWAAPFPTEEEALQVWQEDRKAFRPYDESTGRYLR